MNIMCRLHSGSGREVSNSFLHRRFPRKSCLLGGFLLACLLLFRTVALSRTLQFLVSRRKNNSSPYVDLVLRLSSGETKFESEINKDVVAFPSVCHNGPLLEPIWEWNFSNNKSNISRHGKRLLIATYSAFGNDARVLELTSPINKAYAKMWGHDSVVVQGITMILPSDENCTPSEERSRFNKIDLLLEALTKKDNYDLLLLLDADTLIYNFSFDVSQLVSNTTMLVAQRTQKDDQRATINIDNGITLWNLHHPLTAKVADEWNQACRRGIPDEPSNRGDLYYLRQTLHVDERIATVSTVWDEFYYLEGTVIKSFQLFNARAWNDTSLASREEKIVNATKEICGRYQIDEKDLDHRNYTILSDNTSKGNNTCVPRRKAIWDLQSPSKNTTRLPSKRLLIAQYASFGTYASLLEKTSPINKAYGRKWNHDVLIVQGAALLVETDTEECELPKHRSMYNKIPILFYSLSKTERYDQLLLLDADALIFDMEFDMTTILKNDDMLAALRVNKSDTLRTWNINNGVTLWNLNHNMTKKIAQKWLRLTSDGLNKAHNFGWKEHNDQYYMHDALRREKGAIQATKSLKDEFRYKKATIIKHFLRPKKNDWTGYGMDTREAKIQSAIDTLCANFTADCEDLEHIPYASN